MKHVQAVRFEVCFPGCRAADIKKPGDGPPVYGKLFGMSRDLTNAANRLISAAWLVHTGVLPKPLKEDGSPRALSSYLYQGLSGSWQPFGEPIYSARFGPQASSGVFNALAPMVETRLKTDSLAILQGRQSLATWKSMGIPFRAASCYFLDGGLISLSLFAGTKNNRVTVRPRKTDPSTSAVLQKCADGSYKAGSGTLKWDQKDGRRGKWMLSLAYTQEVTERSAELAETEPERPQLIAGIDIGIQHAAWISYRTLDDAPAGRPDVVQFPERTLRAVARVRNEQRQRLSFNRVDLGVRAGRGRSRKMRATDAIGDRVQRLNDTMLDQIVAEAVRKVKSRGAVAIAIEDHGGWSTQQMHRRADDAATRSDGAKIRADYFRWHQGAFREKFAHVASREGLECHQVAAQWTSRTCHRCGLVWKTHGVSVPPGTPQDSPLRQQGRYELRRFRCCGKHPDGGEGCGYEGHADDNAGHNIAKLGLRARRGEVEPEIAPVKGKRQKKASAGIDAPARSK